MKFEPADEDFNTILKCLVFILKVLQPKKVLKRGRPTEKSVHRYVCMICRYMYT